MDEEDNNIHEEDTHTIKMKLKVVRMLKEVIEHEPIAISVSFVTKKGFGSMTCSCGCVASKLYTAINVGAKSLLEKLSKDSDTD